MMRDASAVVMDLVERAERTDPMVCPPVLPPCPARRGTKYASSICLERVDSNSFMIMAVRERETRKIASQYTRRRARV